MVGQRTNSQKNLKADPLEEGVDVILEPKRSFSIIFRGARTLDLMTKDEVDRDEVLNALDNVIRGYNAAKVKVANEVLLLRYIWLDLDKVRFVVGALTSKVGGFSARFCFSLVAGQDECAQCHFHGKAPRENQLSD